MPPTSAPALVPLTALRRVIDRPHFLDKLSRYVAMDDDELHRVTEVCLRNLGRLNASTGADADLRLILVPELWERLRPGTRTQLRRMTSTLAEYRCDPSKNFWRLNQASLADLQVAADDLRHRITAAADLDTRALVEQARFAIAGSRAAEAWPPDYPVYEPGFNYLLVPAIAWRVISQAGAPR